MDTTQYRDLVESRMREAGYQIQASSPASLMGYTKAFKLQWMASTLHLLVHVATAPTVTGPELTAFTQQALDHAKATKGQMRGFQSGVAVVTAVVGDHVEEDARRYARDTIVRGYAAFAWPTTVDLGTGTRTTHHGRPVIGAVFTPWIRRQIDTLLPEPGAH
ncbi:hypothetical protein [Cellulomonas soli]|uniref:Levansucrase n=1 Tax=Cellulomonas soli TaxID=931535 RepID=A0A512PBG1_9CELL|nr:hypothetical protein [Cellulomonas soli]NYI57268.1 hypothetical protein [Cellulomonas soli]GEP68452.1 hypothetical protein CSO01_11670 [Cellulomonas soli]